MAGRRRRRAAGLRRRVHFVIAGWVVSLCLHEFAHAFTAWRFGDHDVAVRGYLTLNPFKYSHPLLSLVLPVLFIALGGIGLPGGAVYVRTSFMTKRQKTLVSLAGPADQPRVRGGAAGADRGCSTTRTHAVFWAGMAFLGFLQVTACRAEPAAGAGPRRLRRAGAAPEPARRSAPCSPPSSGASSSCCSCSSRRRSTSGSSGWSYWFFDLSGVPSGLVGDRHATSPGSGRPGSEQRLATYASLRIDCSHGCRPRSRQCATPVSAGWSSPRRS